MKDNAKGSKGKLEKLPLTPVEQVLEIFRKVNHYSLKKLLPLLQLKLKEKEISIEVMEKALIVYQKKALDEKKAPHPNYYITVCVNLQKDNPHSYKPEHEDESFVTPLARMI